MKELRYLKIDYIKQHSRIDYDCEDGVLQLYAKGAEDTVLYLLNRTYENLIGTYGDVPAAVRQVTLELCDNSYEHRSPASPTNLYAVPYNFDLLVKEYIVLAGTPLTNERDRIVSRILDDKANLDFYAPDDEGETRQELNERIAELALKYSNVQNPTEKILATMREKMDELDKDVSEYLESINEETTDKE